MDTPQKDRFNMYLKVRTFLINGSASLSVLALIATLQAQFEAIIQDIIDAEGESSEDITGYAVLKKQKQDAALAQGLKVARAATLYYTTNSDPVLLKKVDLLKSELVNMRDTDLYVRLKKVFTIADPIKALIVAPDFAAADVTLLNTLNEEYFEVLNAPQDARSLRSSFNKAVDKLLNKGNDLLENQLDVAMDTFVAADEVLYNYYKSSRLIDNTGSRSELSGFDLATLTIPGNTSVSFANVPPQDWSVYVKNNGPSSLAICIRPNANDTCVGGSDTFNQLQGEEYLGAFSGLGIGSGPGYVIITNLGAMQITVRAGWKPTE